MTVDPAVVPGLLLLALELLALAAIGYVVARVALQQTDDRLALAQGLVIGLALWGLTVNFVLHLLPGRAGGLLAWVLLLVFSSWLGWRRRAKLPIGARETAGFALVTLATFAVALAARQTLIVSDAFIRFGLAAPVQAGTWPPVLPWSPWRPVPYHYGTDMLVGLLAPPSGPNLAFTTELLDAYGWTSLALLVGVTIRHHAGWLGFLILTPLVLSAGAWMQLQGTSPSLLQLPAPTGLPDGGLRAGLADVYWPARQWPWPYPEPHAAPPNIWFVRFTLAYGLALTVLERITAGSRPLTWPSALSLAALVGFLGLAEETLALTVLGLWGLTETVRLVRDRPARARVRVPAAAGLGLAILLLALGGGVLTGILSGAAGNNLSLSWAAETARLRPPTVVDARTGGLAVLGLNAPILAVAAVLLAGRQRQVLTLAAGSGAFLLAALTLRYEAAPQNIARLDGHAGNLALFALLLAVALRLRAVPTQWRYTIAALFGAVIVWPTVALPIRTLAFQVSHGIDLANAQPELAGRDIALYRAGIGRQTIQYVTPSQVVAYMPNPPPPLHARPSAAFAHDRVTRFIGDHTPTSARILSPHPTELTLTTGRPNAAGFAGYLHYVERSGPEYEDAVRFLEPAAVRRLGFAYVHATDAWVSSLPDRARRWLDDPGLFEYLVRGEQHALYRIRPAFLRLNPTPAPRSFEALRQVIPATASVRLAERLQRLDKLRLASVLAHTRLSGTIDTSRIHLLPAIPIEPPGNHDPDVVIVPWDLSLDLGDHEYPVVWWNDDAVAYAVHPSIAPPVDPPPPSAPDFAVRLSDVLVENDRIAFTASFTDHAPEKWTGQDWLVIQLDDTPWSWPVRYEDDSFTIVGTQWFAGQVGPSGRTSTHRYEFDALAGELTAAAAAGELALVPASGSSPTPGTWTLAIRLRQEYLQASIVPVLKFLVSESGQVAYAVREGERHVALNPCPERMQHTDACRNLAAAAAAAGSR